MANILVVPPNDLLRHPIPNRLFHITRRLSLRHEICLLSYSGHPLAKKGNQRGFRCRELTFRSLNVGSLGLYYFLNTPAILQSLNEEIKNTDLVLHANIIPSYLVVRLAKCRGIPTVYDYMDYYPRSASYYFNSMFFDSLSFNFAYAMVKENVKMSNEIVTVSHDWKKAISNMVTKAKVTIVPNGVDEDLFKPLSKEKARNILGLDNDTIMLLYYGSLDLWLEFDQILNLLKSIVNLGRKVLFMIVGLSHNPSVGKELLSKAERLGLGSFIRMSEPLPYETVPLLINASDVVVAPFKRELKNSTSSQKIIETLACAVPIVVPSITEFKLWFGTAPIYYINYNDLRKKITGIIESGHEAEQKREQLHSVSAKVRKEFSWNRLATRYDRIITGLLGA
jgi:glycosyltransferase involved in cell wall biosynthesis